MVYIFRIGKPSTHIKPIHSTLVEHAYRTLEESQKDPGATIASESRRLQKGFRGWEISSVGI